MTVQANTIDDVVDIMDDIIRDALEIDSRLGYFAALYRTVTLVVRDECNRGGFEDNDRMRRLDTIFANRYFAAYTTYKRQIDVPSQCWKVSFDLIDNKSLLILQHLLLGMNAHIALDLGIATATVAEGELTESLKRDFFRLNHILTNLIDEVQKEIASASPLIRYLDLSAWRVDETVVSFAINQARDSALEFAEELIALPEDQWADVIHKRDQLVADISRKIIANTGFPFRLIIWFINLRENKNARIVTELMSGDEWHQAVAQRVQTFVTQAQAQDVDLGKRHTQTVKIPEALK